MIPDTAARETTAQGVGSAGGRPSLAVFVLIAVVACAVSLGVFLRFSLISSGSLWLDELWTLDAVSRSFREMIGARLVSDQSPPLWTVLTWAWLQVAGTYETGVVRSLATSFSLVAIAAPLVGAAWMPRLRPTLLVMAAVFALSLFPVQYAVELRAYSLMLGLGSAATVIWVGLLTGDLPSTARWIFLFCFIGALAGFGHYYGNLLYVCELAVLLVAWAVSRHRRSLYTLAAWGATSLVPVVAWFVLTRRWAPNLAVASAPSIAELETWLTYAFSPITPLLAGQPPGYPDGSPGIGGLLFVLVLVALGGAIAFRRLRPDQPVAAQPVARVGVAAAAVVLLGIAGAWTLSVLMPPSMNTRNLASLLPALFLGVAAAATALPGPRLAWWTGAATAGIWLVASIAFLVGYGVSALTPPWQQEAGYRDAARVLLASAGEDPPPAVIGLKTSWDWHGQWDAVLRAELGARPATSTDTAPLPVQWISGIGELPASPPDGPIIVFSELFNAQSASLFEWAEAVRGPCERHTFGNAAYSTIELRRCP